MSTNRSLVPRVALLLFGSGTSALIYQTVWLREFRLIFGGSTAASAAVLAIFLGGLGVGGFLLGRRIDRVRRPLATYAMLELAVAALAALSPLLLAAVSWIYFRSGGSVYLHPIVAAIVRTLLAIVVLGPATVLMGGTLPAAARAVESVSDVRRLALATIYGSNTLGAVFGTIISTFFLLERFGNRSTLWLAALFNVMVALAALLLDRRLTDVEAEEETFDDSTIAGTESAAPRRFVFAAAAVVGFAFLLMELVWYRVLTPILGGTTFTFGLILAGVLVGIGVGSLFYALTNRDRQPTLTTFAWTSALEAIAIAIPFALGDRLAVLALLLRSVGQSGFVGYVFGWSLLVLIIIVPAAFVAGVQFPVLVGLLGRGRRSVAKDVGYAYGWNTIGSIAGSLGAGFGLLAVLGAEMTWRLAAVLLAALSISALVIAARRARVTFLGGALAAAAALTAVALLTSRGPTAVWRHSAIGAGRANNSNLTPISIEHWQRFRRRNLVVHREGIESTVGIAAEDGYALMVNGKSDGHGRVDAGTQVMSGMIGALLHPSPSDVFVVGLGTGSTAGWLAAAPEVKRVDVVELEPSVIELAHHFDVVNHNVMKNPKARIRVGDGREVLLVERKRKYDLIVSEPSNPYRAGIASLFTADFYRSVRRQLKPGGLFVQWAQAYEVSGATIKTIFATYTSVFPYVYTWQTQRGDMILVGSERPLTIDVSQLNDKILRDPYRTALARAWRASDVEAVMARYLCGPKTALEIAQGAALNTDDRTLIEFAFGRSLGSSAGFDVRELKLYARQHKDWLPSPIVNGVIDTFIVDARRAAMVTASHDDPFVFPEMSPELAARNAVHTGYEEAQYGLVLQGWKGQKRGPSDSVEILTIAEALSDIGHTAAEPFIALLEKEQPLEAAAILGRLRLRQGRYTEAAEQFAKAFTGYRTDPWPLPVVMSRAVKLAQETARNDRTGEAARILFSALAKPFSLHMQDEQRLWARFEIAKVIDGGVCGDATLAATTAFEPETPWGIDYLRVRSRCYSRRGHPLAERARRDLSEFIARAPQPLIGSLESEADNTVVIDAATQR